MTDGLVQHITVEESISIQWVREGAFIRRTIQGKWLPTQARWFPLQYCCTKETVHCNNNDRKGTFSFHNPIALRKAIIAYNFGLSECSRVKMTPNILDQSCIVLLSDQVSLQKQ